MTDTFSPTRALFRTVGPSIGVPDHLEVKNCTVCTPPLGYRCPKCDFETLQKWRMALHYKLEPGFCTATAAQKARKYAQACE